jgi:FlaA1/EpsC-like NDP-sugar epimerase
MPMLMIIGAGEAGAYTINWYINNHGYHQNRIILVDDDPYKQKSKVQGVVVSGYSKDIPSLVERHDVKEIIVAIPTLKGNAYTELINRCTQTKCKMRILSSSDDAAQLKFREINPTDFLAREEVQLDIDSISGYLKGKVVLITGGGGSIGSELCRQVMRFKPRTLCVFDIYENTAYDLLYELKRSYPNSDIKVLIGSVRDTARLRDVFNQVRPEIVFHAAAHKHVPLMEDSPGEAVKNNIIGTRNTLDVAIEVGVKRFVLLSTDKAVHPTSVMGATKRVCEKLIQVYAHKSDMKCMSVRFGNVLGSHGSVIPLFEAQIKAGGPVTVTDPDIVRYFMTIPEAAQLVLQAGGMADNGAVYVLDLGEQVKIKELAEKLIEMYGLVPYEDIQIVYTGLRTGEKMYEELLMDEETGHLMQTDHKKIRIAPSLAINEDMLREQIKGLSMSKDYNVRELLFSMVEVDRIMDVEYKSPAAVAV